MRNVCGLDVHKDNVFVCIDKENGEKIQFKAGVLTKELDALCETLVANDVTEIAMESTSVYRMPIWRVLENDYKMLYQLSHGTYIYKKESLRRMTLLHCGATRNRTLSPSSCISLLFRNGKRVISSYCSTVGLLRFAHRCSG